MGKAKEKTISPGDVISITHYLKVKDVNSNSIFGSYRLTAKDLHDPEIENMQVSGKRLFDDASSANFFDSTQKVTQTKLAELLIGAGSKPFTVEFVKKEGEPRLLVGRLIAPEPLMGRSKVEDLEQPVHSYRIRLVDHRTIQSLVLDGMKYVKK